MKIRSGLFVLTCSLLGGYTSIQAQPLTESALASAPHQQVALTASGESGQTQRQAAVSGSDRFQACSFVQHLAIQARSMLGRFDEPMTTRLLIKQYADEPRVQSYLGSREDTEAAIRQITTAVSLSNREMASTQLIDYATKGFLARCLRSGDQESVGML